MEYGVGQSPEGLVVEFLLKKVLTANQEDGVLTKGWIMSYDDFTICIRMYS